MLSGYTRHLQIIPRPNALNIFYRINALILLLFGRKYTRVYSRFFNSNNLYNLPNNSQAKLAMEIDRAFSIKATLRNEINELPDLLIYEPIMDHLFI